MCESPEDKKESQEAPWKTRGCWEPQKEVWEDHSERGASVGKGHRSTKCWRRDYLGEYEYSEQAGRAQAMVTVAWWEAADMVWRDGNYDSN